MNQSGETENSYYTAVVLLELQTLGDLQNAMRLHETIRYESDKTNSIEYDGWDLDMHTGRYRLFFDGPVEAVKDWLETLLPQHYKKMEQVSITYTHDYELSADELIDLITIVGYTLIIDDEPTDQNIN